MEKSFKADLHIHTKESDGMLSVEEAFKAAARADLSTIAFVDHDTTLGVDKSKGFAEIYNIKLIPGVEMQTSYKNQEIHLLAYYKRTDIDQLQTKLEQIRRDRIILTEKMVKKLIEYGVQITWQEVEAQASFNGVICKTHILLALERKSREDIFRQRIDWNNIASWFRPGGIAYVPYEGNPFEQAVDLIYETGGLPVLAHPGLIKQADIVKELLAYRKIGLEVYYGYWDNNHETVRYYEKISRNNAVLATGGSDYHGFFSPVSIGEIEVPFECVSKLKRYLEIE